MIPKMRVLEDQSGAQRLRERREKGSTHPGDTDATEFEKFLKGMLSLGELPEDREEDSGKVLFGLTSFQNYGIYKRKSL